MYAQLNTKTVYNTGGSTVKLADYLTAAKALGYQTLGISDIDNLHAAHQFMKMALHMGIKPVIAFETTCVIDSLPIQLSFIAKSSEGLRNLYRISSKKNFGFHTLSDMASHFSDVAIVVGSDYAVDNILKKLPKEDVYVGLLKPTVQEFTRPKVPFLSVKYIDPMDANTLTILEHIKNGTKVDASLTVAHSENLHAESTVTEQFDQKSLQNLDKLVSSIHYQARMAV